MAKNYDRIKAYYDAYERKHGRPPPSSLINKAEKMSRTKSQDELDRHVDWDDVPPVLRPIDKINGTRPVNWKPGKRKYFY